jgi:transposase
MISPVIPHHLVRTLLAAHRCCHIIWSPPHAPDLNPVELLWGYLKHRRLANFAPDPTKAIQAAVSRERRRMARHQSC